jgi:hypothetical protein
VFFKFEEEKFFSFPLVCDSKNKMIKQKSIVNKEISKTP